MIIISGRDFRINYTLLLEMVRVRKEKIVICFNLGGGGVARYVPAGILVPPELIVPKWSRHGDITSLAKALEAQGEEMELWEDSVLKPAGKKKSKNYQAAKRLREFFRRHKI